MTAIAAICRPGEIVIAADSRRLSPTNTAQTVVCKIRDLNTLFAAVSGINTYAPTNFDVSQLLPTQMPNVDIGINFDSLCDSILPPLRLALEHLRNNNPDLFQRYALQKKPMGIMCARVQNSVPTLITLNVDVQVPENGPLETIPRRNEWPVLGLCDDPFCSFVGTDEGVAAYLVLAESEELYQGDLVERARGFVQMEIDKQTPEIGGPIDILRLTVDGASWIQRKDGC
jgi:hypothetical protein